jgi:hypothetical protein
MQEEIKEAQEEVEVVIEEVAEQAEEQQIVVLEEVKEAEPASVTPQNRELVINEEEAQHST